MKTSKVKTNKEKWLEIGEAFESLAVTGRHREIARSGICLALDEVGLPRAGWTGEGFPKWIEGATWDQTRAAAVRWVPSWFSEKERRQIERSRRKIARQAAALRALYCYFMAEAEIV